MRLPQNAEEKGESMAEKGNEKAPEATRKAEKGEGSAEKAAKSPGPAPMGGGDQHPTEAAGSKVKDVGDETDPGIGHDKARRQSNRELDT